jgi:hypothetical protein
MQNERIFWQMRSVRATVPTKLSEIGNVVRPEANHKSGGSFIINSSAMPRTSFTAASGYHAAGCPGIDEGSHHLSGRYKGIHLSERSAEWNIQESAI